MPYSKCHFKKSSCRRLRKQVSGKAKKGCTTSAGERGAVIRGHHYPKSQCSLIRLQAALRGHLSRKGGKKSSAKKSPAKKSPTKPAAASSSSSIPHYTKIASGLKLPIGSKFTTDAGTYKRVSKSASAKGYVKL